MSLLYESFTDPNKCDISLKNAFLFLGGYFFTTIKDVVYIKME